MNKDIIILQTLNNNNQTRTNIFYKMHSNYEMIRTKTCKQIVYDKQRKHQNMKDDVQTHFLFKKCKNNMNMPNMLRIQTKKRTQCIRIETNTMNDDWETARKHLNQAMIKYVWSEHKNKTRRKISRSLNKIVTSLHKLIKRTSP